MKSPAKVTSGVGVELSLRLTDGSFESRIAMPLSAAVKDKEAFAKTWLKLMEQGLLLGHGERE